MLSKSKAKYIRSLALQKYRVEHKAFVVEREKTAKEWLNSTAPVRMIIALDEWLKEQHTVLRNHPDAEIIPVTEQELNTISELQTANKVLLVVAMEEMSVISFKDEWVLALDAIRDPGNLGTIIRIADWFGIKNILCSSDCVDAYNPKVIQSAMGSHLRVNVQYGDLALMVKETGLPIYAATLQGKNIYTDKPAKKGIILIGNESAGVSESLISMASSEIMIPRYGGAESLNAAVSAGIICALLCGTR